MNLSMRGSPSHGLAARRRLHPKGILVFRRHSIDLLDVAVVLVIAAILGLCAWVIVADNPNYDGTGNDFHIYATVTGTTDESVYIDQVQVVSAIGEASDWFTTDGGWFESDHHEVHNNYFGGDFWNSQHSFYGVYDAAGNQITLKSLSPGTRVEITGKIRASHSGKSHQDRAVYELVQVRLS
jgi:hypothetical protein